MNFNEKTLKENYVFKGKIINVRKDDVLLPNGNESIREVVEHSGGAAILCEKEGKILMVRQYRYAYGEEVWEIPAGKINPGETPEQTAIREIEEEGGVKAKKVERLFVIYPSPGYTNEKIYVYRVLSFEETPSHLDEDEFLESKWFSKSQLKNMIDNGEIKDGKTLVALLKVL